MLRQLLVLVILTIYSASAIGVPLHYHYCQGELQHVSVFTQVECDSHEKHQKEVEKAPEACCISTQSAHCGIDDPECCDDESDLIQLDDEAAAILLPFSLDVEMCSTSAQVVPIPAITSKALLGYNANAPPNAGPKIYLTNCSFVFYG